MSGSVNLVMIVGNLGADPELRYTGAGTAVVNLRLATNEKYKDKEGSMIERTEWHRVVVWGDQAENCAKYLEKGRSAAVKGKLLTREWEDDAGLKRYTTEIIADNFGGVTFLGGGDREEGAKTHEKYQERKKGKGYAKRPAQRTEANDMPPF